MCSSDLSGLYSLPMPLSLGMEGAGVVEAVGAGVEHLCVGDRVAYASNPPGSYSEVRVMPAWSWSPCPDPFAFEPAPPLIIRRTPRRTSSPQSISFPSFSLTKKYSSLTLTHHHST